MRQIFFFDTMLTPRLVTFVYWVLLLFAVVSGISVAFTLYGVTVGSTLLGLALIAGGVLGARVWCELLIVLFKINENIKKIADAG